MTTTNKPTEAPEMSEEKQTDPSSPTEPSFPPDSAMGPEGILLRDKRITRVQLQSAQKAQLKDSRLSVLDVLVRDGMIDEVAALQAIANFFSIPFRRVNAKEVDPEVFASLPEEYLKSKSVLPIEWVDDSMVVAIHDPADIFLVDDIRARIKSQVSLIVTPQGDIQQAIEDLSAGPTQLVDDIVQDFDEDSVEVREEEAKEEKDLEQMAGESPVIRYVNFLISSAATQGASDIHIEPGEKKLQVRFRIDGILFDQTSPPLQMHAAIISRLKIMSNLDIAERRLPQDGRIRVNVQRRSIDLRVSILPTVHGEKGVIRLLDSRSISIGMENLGFRPETLKTFREEIFQPHGIILVTGPTGSGKSTTLYSAIQLMDRKRMNISTVEDPVEYELGGINQVNVRDDIGMSFAAALRSLLRQDPDVVMVGEIRDPETARIAVQAALTGHLVLSTLHTNDAPSSITRLMNIGVEPFLISASVNAILAQRLVRRICPQCSELVEKVNEIDSVFLEKNERAGMPIYHGAGCSNCRNTGYKGRLGLYELLSVNEKIRDVIPRNPALSELRQLARDNGMVTLREDGMEKIAEGATTVEEVMRVTEL